MLVALRSQLMDPSPSGVNSSRQSPAVDSHRLAHARGVPLWTGCELLQRRFAREHVEQVVVIDTVLALAGHLLPMVDSHYWIHTGKYRAESMRIGQEFLLLARAGEPIRSTHMDCTVPRIACQPLPMPAHAYRTIAFET